jgi:hypothetical protein
VWIGVSGSIKAPLARGKYLVTAGGKGGSNGIPGAGDHNITSDIELIPNPCLAGAPYCPVSTACPPIECNTDKAMCILAMNASSVTKARNGDITFNDNFNIPVGRYNPNKNLLEASITNANGCKETYIAYWRSGTSKLEDPDEFFEHLAALPKLPGLPIVGNNPKTDWQCTGCTTGNQVNYPLTIKMPNMAGIPIFEYKSTSENSPKYLEDKQGMNGKIAPDYCNNDPNFNPKIPNGSTGSYSTLGTAPIFRYQGPNNLPGDDASDGDIDQGSPTDNGIIDEGSGWLWQPTGLQNIAKEIMLHVFPNPASELIQLSWKGWATGKVTIHIKDISGKQCLTKSVSQLEDLNLQSINVSGLKTGIYMLELTDGSRSYTQKILIK